MVAAQALSIIRIVGIALIANRRASASARAQEIPVRAGCANVGIALILSAVGIIIVVVWKRRRPWLRSIAVVEDTPLLCEPVHNLL